MTEMSSKDYADLPRRVIITSSHREKKINSYGIIAYAKDTDRWLLIQCNYNPGLTYILYGAYRPAYIQTILLNLQLEEINTIKEIVRASDEDGRRLFVDYFKKHFLNEPTSLYAYDRLMDLKDEIINFSTEGNLESSTYGIPKGRARYREEPFDAACREFIEETGISVEDASCVLDETIFIENSGISGRRYNVQCWICIFDTQPVLEKFQVYDTDEIKSRGWVKLDLDTIPNSFVISKYPTGEIVPESGLGSETIFVDYEAIDICKQSYNLITRTHVRGDMNTSESMNEISSLE